MSKHRDKQRRIRILPLLLAISPTESFIPQHHHASHIISTTSRSPIHLSAYRDDATSSGPSSPYNDSIDTSASSLAKKPPSSMPNGGRITLLGAGPGDPDLLTVKAHRMLSEENNLVIVDRLVSDEILGVIKGEVKIAKKYPGCAEQVWDVLIIIERLFICILTGCSYNHTSFTNDSFDWI